MKTKQVNKQKRCSSCKQIKPDVQFRLDPYLRDVHDRKVYRNACDACNYERALEI